MAQQIKKVEYESESNNSKKTKENIYFTSWLHFFDCSMATCNDYLLIEFQDTFDLFAKEGRIGMRDLKSIMKSLEGIPPSDDQLKAMIQQVDEDEDGWISFDEFVQLMGNRLDEMDPPMEVKEALETFDANGSGLVSTGAIHKALSSIGDNVSEEEIKNILEKFDDGGTIDFNKLIEEYGADLSNYLQATKHETNQS